MLNLWARIRKIINYLITLGEGSVCTGVADQHNSEPPLRGVLNIPDGLLKINGTSTSFHGKGVY